MNRAGRSIWWQALVLALGLGSTAIAAESLPPVGDVPAQPEHLIVYSDMIRMGARLVVDGTEDLANSVGGKVTLRLEAGFMTDKAAADQPVRLRCQIRFVSPAEQASAVVLDKICYDGNLADTAGDWTLLDLDFKFRPQPGDGPGASGVELVVLDEVAGAGKTLRPSYGWRGAGE